MKLTKSVLVIAIAAIVLFGFASCNNETPAPKAVAEIKWVNNMMGDASASTTAAGNLPSTAAMMDNTYIDANGVIHGGFYQIDNTKFTAYTAGNSGQSYYACYDLLIDPLTAKAGEEGTYLVYVINDETYGTSNSRAKCTKLGDTDVEAKAISIEYYVVEGTYTRYTNTTDSATVAKLGALIEGLSPVVTISVAEDAEFIPLTPAK